MRPTRFLWCIVLLATLVSWWIDRAPAGPRTVTLGDTVAPTEPIPVTTRLDPNGLWIEPPAPQAPPRFFTASAADLATPGEFEGLVRAILPPSQPSQLGSGGGHHVRTALHPGMVTPANPTGEILFHYEYLTDKLPFLGIAAPPATRAMLETLVADLRRVERRQSPVPWPVGMTSAGDARRREIERTLARRVNVDVVDVPLRKVVHDLAREIGLAVSLDRKGLEDEGTDVDLPITLRLHGASARSALSLALAPTGLTFGTHGTDMRVNTAVSSDFKLSLWVHDLAPLLPPGQDWKVAQVAELIENLVAPTSWKSVGGSGKCAPLGDLLVVAQSDAVHEELRRFLAELHYVLHPERGWTEPAFQELDARLAAALATKVRVSADREPLGKLLERVCQEHQVPLSLHGDAVQDPALEAVVSIALPEMPLEMVLETLVGSELVAYRWGDVLKVTTRVLDELPHAPAAFSLRHLRDPVPLELAVNLNLHLDAMLESQHWRDRGGRAILLVAPGGLAVRHDPTVRAQLAAILAPGTPFSRTARLALVEPPQARIAGLVAALDEDDPWAVVLALRELDRQNADPALVRPALEKLLARDVLPQPHRVELNSFVGPLARFGPEPESLTRFLVRFMQRQRISWQGSADLARLPEEFFTPASLETEYLAGDLARRETVCMVVGLLGYRAKDSGPWLTKLLADTEADSAEHPRAMARWALMRSQSPKVQEPQTPPR